MLVNPPPGSGAEPAPALTTLTTDNDIYMRLDGEVSRFATTEHGKALMASAGATETRSAIGVPALSTLTTDNDIYMRIANNVSRFATTAHGKALMASAGASATRVAIGVPEERRVIPLCGYATNDGALTAYGRVRIDPADYTVTGRTLVATLETIAEVSAGGLSLEVTLVDLTHASAEVAAITETATTTTRQTDVATLHASASIYELRAALTGDGYAGLAANLILTWS